MVSPVSPCALRLSGRLYVLSVVAILLLVANHPLGAEDPQALSNEPYFVELRQADRRHDDFAARLEQLVSEIADDHVEVRELWVARSQLYLKIELPALPQDDVEAVLAEINDHPLVERVIAAAVAPHEIRHQERLKKYATIAEIEAGELRGFRPKNRDYWPDLSREHDGRILLKYLEAEVSTPERRQQAEVRVARIHAEFEARVERTMTLGGVPVEVVALPEDVRIEDALAAYLASEDIQYAHPDYIYRNMLDATPNDLPSLPGGGLWGLYKISAPSAWDTRTSSGSVVVAVADTGVDYGHPDLAGNMWTNGSGHHGYNAVAGNSTPLDDHSHGTHVTGTIGAVGNNALDVVGVCWQTSLMAIKVQNSGSLSQPSWIAAGLDFARLNGANIVNASWNCPDDIVIREAFEDLRDAGIIVVNSAGNATTDNDAVLTYPRAYGFPNVLVVGTPIAMTLSLTLLTTVAGRSMSLHRERAFCPHFGGLLRILRQ